MPTIEIAGLCLPLKPQKERRYYSQVNIDKLKICIQLVLIRFIAKNFLKKGHWMGYGKLHKGAYLDKGRTI